MQAVRLLRIFATPSLPYLVGYVIDFMRPSFYRDCLAECFCSRRKVPLKSFEVGVVGAGYVGLVTGVCLAHLGHRVTCVDRDSQRVEELQKGRSPIHEPYLEAMIEDSRDRLNFSTGLLQAVEQCDVVFIAVDTPQGEDGSAELSSVAVVAKDIGWGLAKTRRDINRPLIIVNKSTVPVGSGDYVSMLVEEGMEQSEAREAHVSRNSFRVVSNPEFLREGSAIYDTLFPDRIVVGASSDDALGAMSELYRPIIERDFAPVPCGDLRVAKTESKTPFVATDLASAEMTKYAANAFLATKISFINEISGICELVGADVESVAEGIGLDERIGKRFLKAGLGWGGSCFPKDISALQSTASEYEYTPEILNATVKVNDRQRKQIVAKLQRELNTLKGKRIALLGLAFKPDTDDLREAPSLQIARSLHDLGARVVGYDPVVAEAAQQLLAASGVKIRVAETPYKALADANAAVIVTEWEQVKKLNLESAASEMKEPRMIVDGRNALDPFEARAQGLRYLGFGRA